MHPSRVTKSGSRHTNQSIWDRNHSDGRHGLSVDARTLRILAAVLSHAWCGSHTLPRCPGTSGCSCRSACLGVIFGCRGWCADWGATLGLGFAWSIVVHEPRVCRTRSGCASCAVACTLDPTFSSRVVMGCSSSTPSAISSYHGPFVPRFTVHLHLRRHRRSPFPTLHAMSGWGGGVSIEREDHRKDPLRCEVHNERDRVRIVGRDRRIWIAMARRYDSRTTIFSPEGRLYQVEYAMEAIGHAGACVGVLAKDGIVLAAEKKITSKVRAREPRRTTKERRTRGAHGTRRTKICVDRMGPRWIRSSWTVRSKRRSNVATLPRRTKTIGQSERRTRR